MPQFTSLSYLASLSLLAAAVTFMWHWDAVKPRITRWHSILVTYNIWPGSGQYPGRHRAARA